MRILTLATLLFVLVSQSISAQIVPLEMVPASAAVVVRLQAPEQSLEDLAAFINKVQPGFGELAKAQLQPALGRLAFNPTLTGVDQSRDWYAVVLMDVNRAPQRVLLIPTTDAAAVRKALGTRFDFVEKDEWLACSTVDECHSRFEDCVSGRTKSIDSGLDDRSRSALMSGHVGIFVNAPVLREAYVEELGSAEGRLEDLLQTLGDQIRFGNPQLDIDYILDIYRDSGKMILQGVKDSRSVSISLKFTDDALQIDSLLAVEADSRTDAFFQTQPVSDLARLKSVPEGLTGYMAMHGNPQVLLDWSAKMMSHMLKDETQHEKMAKSLALVRQAKFGTISIAGDLLPDEEAALRYFGLSEIGPSSLIREAMQEFGSGIEYDIGGIHQKQTFETGTEKIDGQDVGIYRIEQTMSPALDPTGMQAAINEKLYGSDGIVQRILVKEGLLLQTLGGGLESLQQLATSAPWSDAQLLAARARQHEKANLLILADAPNMTLKFAKLILSTGLLPVPVQADDLDGLDIPPSYAGFSMAVEKQGLSSRTSIPVETFHGFVQISMFVQQLIGQAQ